jgi:hypothetical protein
LNDAKAYAPPQPSGSVGQHGDLGVVVLRRNPFDLKGGKVGLSHGPEGVIDAIGMASQKNSPHRMHVQKAKPDKAEIVSLAMLHDEPAVIQPWFFPGSSAPMFWFWLLVFTHGPTSLRLSGRSCLAFALLP